MYLPTTRGNSDFSIKRNLAGPSDRATKLAPPAVRLAGYHWHPGCQGLHMVCQAGTPSLPVFLPKHTAWFQSGRSIEETQTDRDSTKKLASTFQNHRTYKRQGKTEKLSQMGMRHWWAMQGPRPERGHERHSGDEWENLEKLYRWAPSTVLTEAEAIIQLHRRPVYSFRKPGEGYARTWCYFLQHFCKSDIISKWKTERHKTLI